MNDMGHSLSILKEIQVLQPNYKDVPTLIARYQELNQNKNLQIYLIGSNSDFVTLCRKIVMTFFSKSTVKILDIAVSPIHTEVLTEIQTSKWEDTIVFRFYRTNSSTGELYVRDFHEKVRDVKAGRGICMTAGIFSEETYKFIEGRPIDLIDKTELVKILNRVDSLEITKL
jgi:hypothetical protein